jgi:hypothetical protein
MTTTRTNAFVIGAVLLGGLLAGMAANKVLVELPAWREVGVIPWANFTRVSDRGLRFFLFPAIGGGALILSIAAAVSFYFDRIRLNVWTVPICAAPVLAIVALIETVFLLAPSRLGLAHAGDDLVELQRIFASVTLGWDIKAFLHVLTFALNIWALTTVLTIGVSAKSMAVARRPVTRQLLVIATFLSGLLAGFNLDRSLVHNSVWRELGPTVWATYSLHADLSVRAAVLYPFLGIGEALLSVAAAASFHYDRSQPRRAVLPIYAGAVFAISGLLMTLLTAPNMLSVPRLGDDPAGLKQALEGFVFWGDIRGILQTLGFLANLWALAVISKPAD